MIKIHVVNIRDLPDGWQHDPQYVYIGRRNWKPEYRVDTSKWANPFHIGIDGSRSEVIYKYRTYLLGSPHLLVQLGELLDKTLVCWCMPKPCHGDVLVELATDLQHLVAYTLTLEKQLETLRSSVEDYLESLKSFRP